VSLDAVSGTPSPAPPSEVHASAPPPPAGGAQFSAVLRQHLDAPKRDISSIRGEIASIRSGMPFWNARQRVDLTLDGVDSSALSASSGFAGMPGWLEAQLAAQETGNASDPYGWRAMSRNLGEQVIGPGYGALFERQIAQESGFLPDVVYGLRVSSAGAQGIAQLMPQYYANVDRLDPRAGLTAGAETMRHNLSAWDGDVRKALASYNAGLGRVQALVNAHGANWERALPAETQHYLQAIVGPATPTFHALRSDGAAVFGGRGPGGVLSSPLASSAARLTSGLNVDFFGAVGAEVQAPSDGVIAEVSDQRVVLDHGNGWRSILEGVATSLPVGSSLLRSQPLGVLGAAGQLRLGVTSQGVAVNTSRYLLAGE